MLALLAVIYVVFISLGLPDSIFGVAWPVIHTEFGIAESFASIYSIIVGVCSGGASFLAGVLIRKYGTANVTLASICLTIIGLLGMSFSVNIWMMIVFAIVLGYGAGAIDTGLNNYVSLHYEAKHMSWLHCFWGIGVTLSPIIMSFFLTGETGNWRNGYRIIAVIQFVIALTVAVALPKWHRLDPVKKEQKSTQNNNQSAGLKDILSKPAILTSILMLGLYCSIEFIFGTWGATFLVNARNMQPDTAAKWVSVYYLGIMLGRLISGFLSMKLEDNKLIKYGALFILFGIIVLLIPVGTVSTVGFLLIGMGCGPIFPSVLHSVPERFGKEYSADITGFHMGGAYASGFLIQLTFGYVAVATTFNITPFVLLALCLTLLALHTATVRKIESSKRMN